MATQISSTASFCGWTKGSRHGLAGSKSCDGTRNGTECGSSIVKKTKPQGEPSLTFRLSEGAGQAVSESIVAIPEVEGEVGVREGPEDFGINASAEQLLGLFDSLHNHRVILRVAIVPPSEKRPREVKYTETLSHLWLDCQGTSQSSLALDQRRMGTVQCRSFVERANLSGTACASQPIISLKD